MGRDVATAAKAFAFSFEFLGTCSSRHGAKLPKRRLTRLTYLVMRWSLVSYLPFTLPHHQLRVASYDDIF